jgi:uncharacterized SAM-binding protein YcdF (DUF218 family)
VGKCRKHPAKQAFLLIPAGVIFGATLFLFRRPLLFTVGDFLVVRDDLAPADVIHVISGPNERVDYGIQLYQQGYARQLFFTGRGGQAQRARGRAVRRGVPPAAVVTDGSRVTSTYSEAVRLKEFIAESPDPIHSVILVSDPFHMRRARWAYRQVLGGQVTLQMAPVPFEQSLYQRRWWSDSESREMVLSEYVKILYYYARYKLSWGPVREWLASFDWD